MRIHYCSDLHLEFSPYSGRMPEGDILILAGDICVGWMLESKKTDARSRKHKGAVRNFFRRALDHFGRVIYLAGNHEPYCSSIEGAWQAIAEFIPPEVQMLENDAIDLGGNALLVGATLWTDMDGLNPETMLLVEGALNDYVMISDFRAEDSVRRHLNSRSYISQTARANPDKTVIVATHHAPSRQGIDPAHTTSRVNGGFASDLETMILDHPNILYWVHGHTHIRKEYQIGHCRVFANCRGYVGVERMARRFSFDPSFEVQP